MYNRLYCYLTINDILYNYQFGFRRNHSTTLALLEVIDNIHVDKNETVIGVHLTRKKLLIPLIMIYYSISCIIMVYVELCITGFQIIS